VGFPGFNNLKNKKMINRKFFFDYARQALFRGKLNTKQVEGMTAILDEWETGAWQDDTRKLAYMLATTYHETACTMQPIVERGHRSYFDKYEPHTRIGKMLGNDIKGDGYLFRGRGFVQLTGRRNYALAGDRIGVNLVISPDLACDIKNATKIMFSGMFEGWFTGRNLSDYFGNGKEDWRNARKIINGLDRADDIARYGKQFYAAICILPKIN
jgi:putative chitinase